MIKKIISKYKLKKINVGVVGLGYVGLPLISRLIQAKINVFGIDNDKKKINLLKKGKKYIKTTSLTTLKYFKKNNKKISSNYKLASLCDVIIICLPTPLKKDHKTPNMEYVFNCAKYLKKYLKNDQLIILESTVYPGATAEFQKKLLNKKFIIGKNIFIGYSPERENPGDSKFNYNNTPKVISGYTKNCSKLVEILYKFFVKKTILVTKIEEAETSKLLENLYRAVNIGLVNEMKIICDKLKIDIFNVINAAATKNFGFQKFLPGPGLGGHCIPIDPFYLSWISKKKGYDPKFIKLSGIINSQIPRWTINKILKNFKSKNIKLLLLGISYKKNVDDDRESPAYEFIKILKNKNIKYDYSDPYFPKLRKGRNINDNKKSIILNKTNLQKYDASILLADHDCFNYKFIAQHSKLIIDTRGKYKEAKFKYLNNIFFY